MTKFALSLSFVTFTEKILNKKLHLFLHSFSELGISKLVHFHQRKTKYYLKKCHVFFQSFILAFLQ